MTEEMKELLTRQLEAAETPDEVDRAVVASMKALVDCQYKTARRVKEMAIEADRRKQRAIGAKWLWGVLVAVASSGGGAFVLKVLAAWGGV